MYSKVFLRILPIGSALPSSRRSARLKIRRSASSTRTWTSSFAAKEDVQVLVDRSEEHTSELQSRPHLVCRLLLEKNIQRPHADLLQLIAHGVLSTSAS